MNIKRFFGAILCVAIPELVGFASSMLAGDIPGKYYALNRPPFSPPGSVFGIAWVILYALMGLSLFFIWINTSGKARGWAVGLFAGQLLLNFLWSPVFFGLDLYWPAVAVIGLLVITVLICILFYWRHSKVAAGLLIPYELWILFATYLNVGVALLN